MMMIFGNTGEGTSLTTVLLVDLHSSCLASLLKPMQEVWEYLDLSMSTHAIIDMHATKIKCKHLRSADIPSG